MTGKKATRRLSISRQIFEGECAGNSPDRGETQVRFLKVRVGAVAALGAYPREPLKNWALANQEL